MVDFFYNNGSVEGQKFLFDIYLILPKPKNNKIDKHKKWITSIERSLCGNYVKNKKKSNRNDSTCKFSFWSKEGMWKDWNAQEKEGGVQYFTKSELIGYLSENPPKSNDPSAQKNLKNMITDYEKEGIDIWNPFGKSKKLYGVFVDVQNAHKKYISCQLTSDFLKVNAKIKWKDEPIRDTKSMYKAMINPRKTGNNNDKIQLFNMSILQGISNEPNSAGSDSGVSNLSSCSYIKDGKILFDKLPNATKSCDLNNIKETSNVKEEVGENKQREGSEDPQLDFENEYDSKNVTPLDGNKNKKGGIIWLVPVILIPFVGGGYYVLQNNEEKESSSGEDSDKASTNNQQATSKVPPGEV